MSSGIFLAISEIYRGENGYAGYYRRNLCHSRNNSSIITMNYLAASARYLKVVVPILLRQAAGN